MENEIQRKLSEADELELQKCKDSPTYFYNKYVRKEGQRELNEKEYDAFVKMVEQQRHMPLKLRRHYKDIPLTPNQCFLPDFLQKDKDCK